MSSSSNYRSSQLHRVSLHSNGKRPFEECGYDSDPDTSLNSSTQASGSGSSGSSRHFPSSSTSSSSGEGRNKRARSTSSSSTSDLSSSSDVSTSTGYDTAPSSSRSDLIPGGPSALSRRAVDCPVPTAAMFDPQDGVMSDLSIELPRPAFTTSVPTTTTTSSEDSLRSSLERFNEFERQIAALRSSFAASRSPLPSQMGSSEHAHQEWHAMSSGFPSTGLSTSDASDVSVHLVPTDSFSSPPAVQSTSGVAASLPPASSASSGLYSPQHSSISRFQVYRPPLGARQSVGQGHSGAGSVSYNSIAPSRLASTNADIGMRQSTSGPVSSPPPSPQLRPVRRSPSPLILDPVVSSYGSDDSGILGDRDVSSDPRPPVGRRTTDNIFPESSLSFVARSDSHTRASPEPIEARHRVIRQHSAERVPTPSVFDVFGIEDSLPHRNASGRGSPARERPQTSTPFQVDAREPEPGRFRGRTTSITTSANRPNFHSRLYSMPSTNSLMSENAAEHRQILAREQIWTPFRRNSGEVADHDDDSPSDASSRSEVILVPNRGEFGQGDRPGPSQSVVPTTQGGREPGGVRRQENRLETVRPFVPRPPSPFPDPMVSHSFEPLSEFFATNNPASSGSHRIHRETSSPTNEWSPPYAGQQHQQQAPTSTSYSYTNLNLDSFQSGMFRDSLQRSADVHRPTISRQLSWNVEEDSDSSDDMDFGIMRPPQPSSPPLRDRLRAFATGMRSQRDVAAALDRAEPTPSRVNDERTAFRERQQDMARGLGPTLFGRQNVAGGAQPSNVSFGGNRVTASRDMDPIRGQRDESRRRPISALDSYRPPGPNLNRAVRPGTPDDEPVARRPFAGGILQRLANIQRSSDSTPSASSSQPGSRGVPPPPVGGRPTLTRNRRVTLPDAVHDADTPFVGRISLTPAPTSAAPEMSRREGVPWRSFISGLRGPEADSASGPPVIPTRVFPPPEERSTRLRSLRQRVQLDRGDGSMPRRPGGWRSAAARRSFPPGDYVPDELFDSSYEALLSLSNAIGEVRSKVTPEDVIAALPSATYKEWAKEDSETRCPICLDDYEPFDMVTKLLDCSHWLHKHCLEQWLRTANTCPVCRKKVKTSDTTRKAYPHQRVGNVNMPVANNGPSQNNSASLPSRPLPSISYSSIPPPPNFLHSASLARAAAASRRPPRPGRAETLPVVSRNTVLDEENHSHDHSGYVYEAPHYLHASQLHSHLSRAPVPRPSPLQRYANAYPPQPQSYIHGPMREGYDRFSQRGPGPTTEQLFLPLPGTSPSDQTMDSRSRPIFSSMGTSTLNVEESPQQIPQPGLGLGQHTAEPIRSSMVTPVSSVMFTPQSSPPITSRSDASSVAITNSTQNPMVVTNRTSAVYPRTTSFSIEHANTPHHHVHAGPPSQAPHGPMFHLTEGTSRVQDISGRWQVHTSSTFLRDRPSGESVMYPWWE